MKSEILWARGAPDAPALPPLAGDASADVVIVGGGMVGLAAAELLAPDHDVVLLEALTIGRQATGRSTAKATSQHGPIYRSLVSDLGEDGARAYAQANEAAVDWIAGLAGPDRDVCERTEARIFAQNDREVADLRQEAETAAGLGIKAHFAETCHTPFPCRGALVFADQAQINPYRFLRRLADGLRDRARIHEGTRVVSVEHGDPCTIRTESGTIRARWVIVATHLPTVPEGKFFAKAFPHAHGVLAARLAGREVPPGMWISAGSPTRSFRTARIEGEDWIVATGEGFRPGEGKAQDEAIADIASWLQASFGLRPEIGWTNEDFMPMDGLPFVGAATGSTPNLLVATGFNAWGITKGVVAAQILAETVRGGTHPLAAPFAASRLRPLKGATNFLSENMKAGYQMVRDRALRSKVESLDAIGPGDGGIVKHDGKQVAVSRDADGRITAVSAVCTHLGCIVGWNALDRTWDCPCHGSRFTAEGTVLAGPASTPLERVALTAELGNER